MGNLYPCVMACANASTSLTGIFRVTVLCSVQSALTKYQSEGYARCLKVSLSLELTFTSLQMWDESAFHFSFLFNEKYLWAFRFRGIAPRLKVLQNAARTQRRAVLDVHPHLVRVFQFPAQMARVICTAWIHESLS